MLLPEKALYWKEEQTLIVADLHIGKVGHFRKAGIPIPKVMEQEELAVLSDLIRVLSPKKLLLLGDLFHSELNNDWNWLQLWAAQFPSLKIILIKGNHDILHKDIYEEAGVIVLDELVLGPFTFVHEPPSKALPIPANTYFICGHIHPGVKIRGQARQSLLLSCFHFAEHQAVLPAFGKFTGKYCLPVTAGTKVFGVVKEQVIAL